MITNFKIYESVDIKKYSVIVKIDWLKGKRIIDAIRNQPADIFNTEENFEYANNMWKSYYLDFYEIDKTLFIKILYDKNAQTKILYYKYDLWNDSLYLTYNEGDELTDDSDLWVEFKTKDRFEMREYCKLKNTTDKYNI